MNPDVHARACRLIDLWWVLPAGVTATLFAWRQQRAANQDDYATLPR